jgi:hypothetical protein
VNAIRGKDLQWLRDRRDRMVPGEFLARVQSIALRQFWERSLHLRRQHGRIRSRVNRAQRKMSLVGNTTVGKTSVGNTSVLNATNSRIKPFAALDLTHESWLRERDVLFASGTAARLMAGARELMNGSCTILGITRNDLDNPDWDLQPQRELPMPFDRLGQPSAKAYWELSRGNLLTSLAAATALSGDNRYIHRAIDLLTSWCEHFSHPTGPMWHSGVELGIRMQSWAWMRRVEPERCTNLFMSDPVRSSIQNHVEILLRFPSTHSSANNHRLVEASGLLTAGCAFDDLLDRSQAEKARRFGLEVVLEELHLQVSLAGMHREQAVDYHCFALEVSFFALLEAELFGIEVPEVSWTIIHRMADALHAICDRTGVGPRFGDSDNSHVVQFDKATASPTIRSLTLFGNVFHGPATLRGLPPDARSSIVLAIIEQHLPRSRRSLFRPFAPLTDRIAIALDGLVVTHRNLESKQGEESQVWLALRSGPLGYLPIAAHAHADLNAVELRFNDCPLIIDPGTYVYGEDSALRQAMRQTAAHSTVTYNGESQARSTGPFLWGTDAVGVVHIKSTIEQDAPTYSTHPRRLASDEVIATDVATNPATANDNDADRVAPGPHNTSPRQSVTAMQRILEVGSFSSEHDGFCRSKDGPAHRRSVEFSPTYLEIQDRFVGTKTESGKHSTGTSEQQSMEVTFLIDAEWNVSFEAKHLVAHRDSWSVDFALDPNLSWTIQSKNLDGSGWFAPTFGELRSALALRGTGHVRAGQTIRTHIEWHRLNATNETANNEHAHTLPTKFDRGSTTDNNEILAKPKQAEIDS